MLPKFLTAAVLLVGIPAAFAQSILSSSLKLVPNGGYPLTCNEKQIPSRQAENLDFCVERLANMTDICRVEDNESAHFCAKGGIKISGRTWYKDGVELGGLQIPCSTVGEALMRVIAECSIGVVQERWPGVMDLDIVVHYGTDWV
ncbi:hypothetical protein BT63DRAFT_452222 [Microthyrium microscopicum]|uniref:Cyanovirin-N domain-containing protein n=1 Tax=Microthyrium microscopicum TaxID=703497 RepID=A0A6A6UHH0_9PEZI|nr:hypothetical protein BT63DRAFT_452222 [Microthyrium microscopicum]